MPILNESSNLIIKNNCENAIIINRNTGNTLASDDFIGDPCCALIGANDGWAVIGGEHLFLWVNNKGTYIINETNHPDLKFIFDLKINDQKFFLALTDPWSDSSAIFKIYIDDQKIDKLNNFNSYKNLPYTNDVVW